MAAAAFKITGAVVIAEKQYRKSLISEKQKTSMVSPDFPDFVAVK